MLIMNMKPIRHLSLLLLAVTFISCSQKPDPTTKDQHDEYSQTETETDSDSAMSDLPDIFNPALQMALQQDDGSDKRISIIIQTNTEITDQMLKQLQDAGIDTRLSLNKKITANGTATSIKHLADITWIRAVELSQTRNKK